MSELFIKNVKNVLNSNAKYIVFGDAQHGEKSLKSLAAAVKQGDLAPLGNYVPTTILIEGVVAGNELTFEKGRYKDAIEILAVGDAKVMGCEDKASLSTQSEIDKLIQNPPHDGSTDEYLKSIHKLMAKRIPDANKSWSAQVSKFKGRVIVCCGTSHLPIFRDSVHFDLGLVNDLRYKAISYGFAVEEPNSPNNTYTPEKSSGMFGPVDSIGCYDGWDRL